MKKLLSLLLALMMLGIPALSVAENVPAGDVLIGGADAPTNIVLTNETRMPDALAEDALAAGRRVTSTLTVTDIAGIETGDPTMDAAMADLFNALALRISQQGDEQDMALQISGQDALNLGFASNGEDMYIKSNLLGGAIVVNVDEIEPLLNRLLDMLVLMEAMTEEDAAALREQLAMLMESFAVEMESTIESAVSMEDFSSLNTKAIEEFIAFVQGKTAPIEEIVVPRMCDPAVAGVQAVLTNEDMIVGMKAIYQFLLDNPALTDYLGSMLGFYTDEELELDWQNNGELYQAFDFYASKEEFLADNETFAQLIARTMAEVDSRKVLDGEFVITMYVDEAAQPVYATMSLPLFMQEDSIVEDSTAVMGETANINVTYSRQTVAAGVSHVVNIDIDGETVSIDVLVGENTTSVNIYAVPANEEAVKFMDVNVKNVDDTLTVEANIYDGPDQKVLSLLLDGECEFTDVRNYYSGKLTMTVYEEYDGVQTENSLVFAIKSDYAINGVDFSGVVDFAFEVDGIRMGVQVVSETSDSVPSIMAGDVVRPMELDDNAFANWFVGMINSLNNWLNNLIVLLPESVLTMIISAGM